MGLGKDRFDFEVGDDDDLLIIRIEELAEEGETLGFEDTLIKEFEDVDGSKKYYVITVEDAVKDANYALEQGDILDYDEYLDGVYSVQEFAKVLGFDSIGEAMQYYDVGAIVEMVEDNTV